MLSLLALLAFGNVVSGTDHSDGASLVPDALETNKRMALCPADLAISPPVPELVGVGLQIGGIERRFDVRPNPCYVIGMHPPLELLNICPVFGNVEHLFDATIPPDEATDRIVLPRPELGCVEGQLQTISVRLHLLALDY